MRSTHRSSTASPGSPSTPQPRLSLRFDTAVGLTLAAAGVLLAASSALAGGTVKADIDNRNGTIVASDNVNDPAEYNFVIDSRNEYDPLSIDQTVQENGRIATLVHSSQWLGANPAVSITGFTMSESITATKPSGVGFANGGGSQSITFVVTGSGGSLLWNYSGMIDEQGGEVTITLVGPGVNSMIDSNTTWNGPVVFTDGEYTLTVNRSASVSGSPAGSESLSYEVNLLAPSCGGADAGSCYAVHPGNGCDVLTCCNAVCNNDPSCCTTGWDQGCVDLAISACATAGVSGVVINPANGHRYQLVSPAGWNDYVSFAAGSNFGGTFGCPLTVSDAFENQWVRCYLASNVLGIAGPTDLFISEYQEGNVASNRYIELYNGTTGSVDLTAGDYKLLIYADGSATATGTFPLAGTVPSGGTWVVAPSNVANATILAAADQLLDPTFAWNGNDAIALVKGAGNTPLDVFGQIGFNPGTQWGSGATATANNTLHRNVDVCAGDPNGSDAFDPALQWDGIGTTDTSDIGMHVASCSGPFSVWTGFNDVATEGNFVWWCAEPVNYTNWLPGEPNNGGNSDFTELLGDSGQWRDRGNAALEYGVTEFEFIVCGTGGSCFATHAAPGCNNESCCQTVCFIDNFCCDTSWDSACVNEANGLCSPPVLAGPIFNPATGHHYYLLDKGAWSEAQEAAQGLNGYLATIGDAAENAWVLANVSRFDGNMTRVCFLGFNDQLVEGTFQWLDHAPATYTNWSAGEPNNSGGIEHFAQMFTDGTWNDNDNTGAAGFTTFAIVEVPCLGDFDGNGMVDGGDLGTLLGFWGTSDKTTDLNHDGIVNGADLGLLLGGWGPCN